MNISSRKSLPLFEADICFFLAPMTFKRSFPALLSALKTEQPLRGGGHLRGRLANTPKSLE
jgi:hypothetical protein